MLGVVMLSVVALRVVVLSGIAPLFLKDQKSL
jgi:hypothetical protein